MAASTSATCGCPLPIDLPIDAAGLCLALLHTEPRMAVLPVSHRLAGKEEVTEADLAGESPVWGADMSTQPTRRPHPDAGYLVRGVDETLEHVAAGRGISFLARSATVFYSRPDVVTCPFRTWRSIRCAARWRHRISRGVRRLAGERLSR